MTTYLKFTEVNDHEGETWHHYLPIEGNEAALEQLRAYLAKAKTECHWEFPYELGTEPIAESDVDTLVKHADMGYMAQHNKVAGVLKKFDTSADPDDLFYKGQIEDLFGAGDAS
jgi:hypothetical protein